MFRRSSTKQIIAAIALVAVAWIQPAAAVEVRIPRQPGIPPAAEEVLAGFEKQAQAILERSTEQMRAKRAQAVQRLQALLQTRMQAADLDGALAIRQMIRSLEESAANVATYTGIGTLANPPTGSPVPIVQSWTPTYPAIPAPITATPPVLSVPTLTAVAPPAIAADPGDLTAYRSQIGRNLYFSVRGDQGGSGGVWGTGLYTHDSSLARAAVHAGVLQPGEQGIVLVTILKGPTWFQGSTRNGVTAGDWNNADGYYSAYLVERAPSNAAFVPPDRGVRYTQRLYPAIGVAPFQVLPDPGNMDVYFNRIGESFLIAVTGANDGTVWGTDYYTYDSDLSSAAVHAGIVPIGGQRLVRVTIEKAPPRFFGSHHNGVTSHDWDNSGGHYTAYRIFPADFPKFSVTPAPSGGVTVGENVTVGERYTGRTEVSGGTLILDSMRHGNATLNVAPLTPALEPLPPVPLPDPGNLLAYRGLNGREFYFRVTGRAAVDYTIWGTDVYTDDSCLAIAAVHAGALRVGESGLLKVAILPGRNSYQGSNRNGVKSESYPAYGGSYRIERYQEEPVEDTSIRPKAPEATIRGGGTIEFPANTGVTDSAAPPATPTATIRGGGTIVFPQNTGFRDAGTVRDTPTGTVDLTTANVREVPGDTDMQSVNPGPGRAYYLRIKGRTDGQLWGNDVYTSDSSVGTAAVHAGVLRPGETGVVKVTITPGQSLYEGTARNGVMSSNYRSWDVSYQVEKDDR